MGKGGPRKKRKLCLMVMGAMLLAAVMLQYRTLPSNDTSTKLSSTGPSRVAAELYSQNSENSCVYQVDTDIQPLHTHARTRRSAAASSKEQCCGFCKQDPDCGAAVYLEQQCWFKPGTALVPSYHRGAFAMLCHPSAVLEKEQSSRPSSTKKRKGPNAPPPSKSTKSTAQPDATNGTPLLAKPPPSLHTSSPAKASQPSKVSQSATQSLPRFRAVVKQLRAEFAARYGGVRSASTLFRQSVKTFGQTEVNFDLKSISSSTAYTAARILSAVTDQRPFVAAFAGYSTVVGRGNFFHQSYPLVLGQILQEAMQSLGLPQFEVRNVAIGGIASFPTGWCMRNTMGDDVDLVSWEFGKNEQKQADGLESFLRHMLTLVDRRPPKFVLMDDVRSRGDLIQKYSNLKGGFLPDPIVIDVERPAKNLLDAFKKTDGARFGGIDRWEEWGAPPSCPGRAAWHIKLQGHEMRAWVLAMHLLDPMELVADLLDQDRATAFVKAVAHLHRSPKLPPLPPPFSPFSNAVHDLASLRFGTATQSSKSSVRKWGMGHVSCRTLFAPFIQGGLEDILVSPVAEQKDVLNDRDENLIKRGRWVKDVGELERKTKLKVQKCGGLGYVDMKLALYGIQASGRIQLWLPTQPVHGVEAGSRDASSRFKTLVVCEVNEKRKGNVCDMEKDLFISVGGKRSVGAQKVSFTGAVYLGMQICLHITIPQGSQLTTRSGAIQSSQPDDAMGLSVEISVQNPRLSNDGACSIAHVVWEEHQDISSQ